MAPVIRMLKRSSVVAGLSAFGSAAISGVGTAMADGIPQPGQIAMQPPGSPIAVDMVWFHDKLLLPIIIVISVFVAVLLGICIVRFNEKANPVPTKTTHNTALEIAWTLIPVLILFAIAIPSMKLLTDELVVPKTDMTIKVTGKQWYWTYEYPKDQNGGFSFDSNMVKGADLKPGMIRQLSVDNTAVVPVGKKIHMLVTGADVIHEFAIPALGVRVDAVPGRMNESWFEATKEGMYYGECSNICGVNHSDMPIAIKVVSDKDYQAWLEQAKKEFAANDAADPARPVRLAGAQ